MMEEVRNDSKGEHWRMLDGLILIHNKVYVAPTSPTHPLILASAQGHSHEGTKKMLHRLRADFFIPGVRATIQDLHSGPAAAASGAHDYFGRRGHGFHRCLTAREWSLIGSPNIATSCTQQQRWCAYSSIKP
jgi:hypothetical protein